jgi:hypothetical protein
MSKLTGFYYTKRKKNEEEEEKKIAFNESFQFFNSGI